MRWNLTGIAVGIIVDVLSNCVLSGVASPSSNVIHTVDIAN
jgi:hypothetical protein